MSTLNIDTIADQAGTAGPDFVAMPTVAGDPVVESGSNSDGSWTKWADGTQHAYGGNTASSLAVTTAMPGGNGYYRNLSNDTLTNLPVAFVGRVRVSAHCKQDNPDTPEAFWLGRVFVALDASSFRYYVYSPSSRTVDGQINWTAMGRWK